MSFAAPHHRFDAVICDIDGCLSPESSTPMDVEALALIAAHNRAAQTHRDRSVVTLCSGRPQPFAEAMCRMIANASLPLIAENGVWMYLPSSNQYLMDPAITREHRSMVRDLAAWLDETLGPMGVTQQPGKACSVSLFHPDTPLLAAQRDRIAAECRRRGWPIRVSMTWLYINCDLAHISKATGIARFLQHTGLRSDRCAGIGDTSSDLAIRDAVAYFACPANAVDEIKSRSDYVAAAPEARGVLEILSVLGVGARPASDS